MMDISTLKDWAAVFAATLGFGSFGLNLWTRHVDRRTALRGTYDVRIEAIRELATGNAKRLDRLDAHDLPRRVEAMGEIVNINLKRIDRLEFRMETVATREDVAKVDRSVVEMRGQVDVVVERLKPLAAISARLQEFLILHSPPPPGEPHP